MVATATLPQNIYTPKGGARRLFHCKASRILMDGPAGTGKTRGILEYSHAVMDKYPGLRVLACRKTRASMTDSVLVTLETKVLGADHPLVLNGPSRETRREYEMANGSVMVIGGLDKPEKTFSAEYDLVLVFEAIECDTDDIELLIRTLRNGARVIDGKPIHQLIMDTNPGPQGHWLNHRDDWLTRIISRHEDNPYLWDDEKGRWTEAGIGYIANLDALTGHRLARLRHGRWVASEGAVYPEFDVAIHVIDEMPAGWQSWPKRRGIDFGFKDPFVCQWWALHDGDLYLYREIYHSERTVKVHAEQINRLSSGESYEMTVADHDAEDRATLAENGIDSAPATKDIAHGVDAVRTRLVKGSNGKPSIYILRSALVEVDQALVDKKRPTCTIDEMDCYIWKKHRDGIEKDEPVDRDNHGLDTLRYVVMSLGNGGFMWGFAG